ncbi:MAG TPA: prephenate dehydrogenase/arogenate dehydrogenase family protein [Candidatus Acidoferrum sp.]|nr:prephenate dehydrogenase/arogenate dehydrogenase family protein [Candidatus Acidoferrum sp.]
MPHSIPFRRVAIVGSGLIGGSFGLALRRHFPDIAVIGFDRPDVLQRAVARGAVQEPASTLENAVRGADLVYVGLPIGATIAAFPTIAASAESGSLITDACGAKTIVCKEAGSRFANGTRFLGGHPMAGREVSGIENADAEIFAGAPYALIGAEDDSDPRVQAFAGLLRAIGAKPVWCDADTHDWAVGVVSHLPQLLAVALARVVSGELDETGLPLTLAGKGLQDTLRLAGSPYGVWRDVFIANRENVSRALERLAQEIDHLRRNLSSRELEEEFRAANELFALLQNKQQKTEG